MPTYHDALATVEDLIQERIAGTASEDRFREQSVAAFAAELEGVIDPALLQGLLRKIDTLAARGTVSRETYEAISDTVLPLLYGMYRQEPDTGEAPRERTQSPPIVPGELEKQLALEPRAGVQGWLLALSIFMALVLPLICLFHYDDNIATLRALHDSGLYYETGKYVVLADCIGLFLLLLAGISCGLLLFFKKRAGYRLALAICGAVLALTLAEAAYLYAAGLDQEFKTLWFGKKKVFWICSCTMAAGILYYLLASKRVRAIYFRARA